MEENNTTWTQKKTKKKTSHHALKYNGYSVYNYSIQHLYGINIYMLCVGNGVWEMYITMQ